MPLCSNEHISGVSDMSESETSPGTPAASQGQGIPKKTVMIAAVIITAILIAAPLGYLVLTSDNGTDRAVLVTIKGKSSSANLTMSDLKEMTYAEQVSTYQNRLGFWRAEGTYRGVTLEDLAETVGGMVPGDIMTIEAKDGYTQNLSYYQVYHFAPNPVYATAQGDIVLSYMFNGTEVPEWTDGPMIAVLSPDHSFSNDDFNMTADRDPEFSASTSAGSLWVKNVRNITIASVYNEWNLSLTNSFYAAPGYIQWGLPRTEFVSLDFWYGSSYVDSKDRNWTGVPIEHILGIVDDLNFSAFNSTLLETKYRVTINALDGFNKTVIAKDLVSGGAIVANRLNGSILSSDYAPLRIVGPGISSSSQVGMIGSLELIAPEIVILNVKGDTNITFSMAELKDMPSVTLPGSLIKSTGTIVGPNTFKGVTVNSLIEMVYTGSNYSLEVIATDGYSMTFTSSQVINGTFAYYDTEGNISGVDDFTMLLAYEMDGNPLSETLRIVIVDDSSPITDGHFWAKYVRYIIVRQYTEDWSISLSGLTEMTMDRQTYESVASCYYHTLSYTLTNTSGDFVYEGVALWVLVAAVDGADAPDGHYMFNDMLANAGYNITVYATDGYNRTFSASQVARNNSMIVANEIDGDPLGATEFPLRLVGENLTSGQMVKKLSRIVLQNISTDMPLWNLTLTGTRTVVFDSGAFESLYNCGVHSAWYNFTNASGDHSYAGIPLWVLVGAVDGDDGSGHYVWNTTLAALGYTVKVSASDGYNATFPVADVANNDTLILAFMLDGAYLTGTEFPLRLVGDTLPGSMKVRGVVTVELLGLPT
jgi:DMSO/TMAO reductase YedYZ molybdopterin-dependent catalytic subunit